MDEELKQAEGGLASMQDGVKQCPVSGKLTTEGSCPMAKPRPKKKLAPDAEKPEPIEPAEAAAEPAELEVVTAEQAGTEVGTATTAIAAMADTFAKPELPANAGGVVREKTGSTAAGSDGSVEQKEQKEQKEEQGEEKGEKGEESKSPEKLPAEPEPRHSKESANPTVEKPNEPKAEPSLKTDKPQPQAEYKAEPQAEAQAKAQGNAASKASAKAVPKANAAVKEAATIKEETKDKAKDAKDTGTPAKETKPKPAPKKKKKKVELTWDEQLKRKRAEMDKMEKMGLQFHEMGGKLDPSSSEEDSDDGGCPASSNQKTFDAELKRLKKEMREKMTQEQREEMDNPWMQSAIVPEEERKMKKNMFLAFYRDKYNKLKKGSRELAQAAPDMSHYDAQNAKLGLSASGGHMPMPRPKGIKPPPDFQKPVGRLSPAEMLKFGCENKRILISIHGDIFDISDRPDKYGAEGPYWYMAGHDLTWGLIIGDDAEAHLDKFYDLFKIMPKEACDQHLQGVMSWWAFYEKEYGKPVGRNTGYDKEWGLPPPPNKGDGIDPGKCTVM